MDLAEDTASERNDNRRDTLCQRVCVQHPSFMDSTKVSRSVLTAESLLHRISLAADHVQCSLAASSAGDPEPIENEPPPDAEFSHVSERP